MGNNNSFLDASRTGDSKKISEYRQNYKKDNNATKDEKGRTALILSSLNGNVEIVELLIQKGFNLEDKCDNGLTALLYASSRGYLKIVQLLLLNGADIEACDKDGATSLLYAAHKGHLEVVKLLLEEGADVQVRNSSGMSALIYASHQGFADIAEVLLVAGADTEARGEESRLQVAIRRALLLKHESAAAEGGSDPSKPAVEQQREIDSRAGGYTALMRAASFGYVEVVKVLLEKGADRDASTSELGKKAIDFARDPPSHIDHTSSHDEVVQLLLMHQPSRTATKSRSSPGAATLGTTTTAAVASLPRPSLSLFLEDKDMS